MSIALAVAVVEDGDAVHGGGASVAVRLPVAAADRRVEMAAHLGLRRARPRSVCPAAGGFGAVAAVEPLGAHGRRADPEASATLAEVRDRRLALPVVGQGHAARRRRAGVAVGFPVTAAHWIIEVDASF